MGDGHLLVVTSLEKKLSKIQRKTFLQFDCSLFVLGTGRPTFNSKSQKNIFYSPKSIKLQKNPP